MTGTELVNIIKSPTSKIVMFGTLLITGALILVPILNRNCAKLRKNGLKSL